MIRGAFVGGWPLIGGRVSLPRLGLGPVDVAFLLDTGADLTMLHPRDASLLRINFRTHFQGIPRITIPGVGIAPGYEERATIELPHLDGRVDVYDGLLTIAIPSNINRRHPSLLGRDIFDNYSIVYNQQRNILVLQ